MLLTSPDLHIGSEGGEKSFPALWAFGPGRRYTFSYLNSA